MDLSLNPTRPTGTETNHCMLLLFCLELHTSKMREQVMREWSAMADRIGEVDQSRAARASLLAPKPPMGLVGRRLIYPVHR